MSTKKGREGKPRAKAGREPLDVEKLVQAALTLLDEAGLEQLTTRRLAEALGVRSASLYWHIRDKAELLQLLAESISSKVQLPDPGLPWQDYLAAFARANRAAYLSIRDSAEVLQETPPLTPKRLLLIEAVFGVLLKAGFSPKETVMATMLMSDYLLSFVRNEMLVSAMTQSQGAGAREANDRARDFFGGLSPDQYPSIIKLADIMADYNADEQFEWGVKMLISSLELRLATSRRNDSRG